MKLIPTAGGSELFMNFIEKEMQPYIEKNYRANNTRTLIGQSLGGLLATEVLLKRPYLFNNYIIISPSLWWDNESLLSKTTSYLNQQNNIGVRVYLSSGTEGEEMESGVNKLANAIQQSGKIKLYHQPLPEETHLTIFHNSVYKALQQLNQ